MERRTATCQLHSAAFDTNGQAYSEFSGRGLRVQSFAIVSSGYLEHRILNEAVMLFLRDILGI